jgi:tRNA pseudouridine55 synthase
VPPRGLDPTGIILVDKPAGPSSFAIVARVRRRTGARTGHAGTLDPFATGLLLLLSGKATRLASWFVGLDKRYLSDVDLSARTSTGDPEGEVVERLEPRARTSSRPGSRASAASWSCRSRPRRP